MNEIGKWVEKEVFENKDFPIYEWQSARCSVCGKYHTTPYQYYFDNFDYCPCCGSKMTTKKEDKYENSLEKEIEHIQNEANVIQQRIGKLKSVDTYEQYDNRLKEILHVIQILNNIKNKKTKEIEDVIKGITICYSNNPENECCDCPYYNKEADFCSDGDKRLSEDILDWIYFYNWVEKQWKRENNL